MDILTWLVVGLVAGALASYVMDSGYGIGGDLILGIAGAFVGGWGFRALGWSTPFHGILAVVFMAFIGATMVFLVVRLISGRRLHREA